MQWYDVWKNCQQNGACFGRLIEGIPHSEPDLDLCPDDIDPCYDCISGLMVQRNGPIQSAPAESSAKFSPSVGDVHDEEYFYAEVDGQYLFKILTLRTTYQDELVRVRRIGVQVKSTGGEVPKPAAWSKEPEDALGSQYVHHINVTFKRKNHLFQERYRVTTASAVDHP